MAHGKEIGDTSHPWLNYDSHFLTEALYNDNSSKRHGLAVAIRKALRLNEADGFDLVDIGMHNYAVDVNHAPYEFAIVDRQYPHGLQPTQIERGKHDLYDSKRVVQLLAAAGCEGALVDPHEQRTGAKGRGVLLPVIENDGTKSWVDSDQANSSLAGFVFPASLEVQHPETFTLTLPSPLHEHTILLMRAYGRCLAAFPELVTQAYTWFRSWGTSDFRPLTVALLLVTYLQRSPEVRAPDIQNIPSTMADPDEHTVWVPYRARAGGPTMQLPLLVRYASSLPQKTTEGPGVLFAGFIRWIKNMKSAYHGSVGRSRTKPKHVLHRPVVAVAEMEGWGKHASNILNVKPSKTEPWTWQPIVMVDPFVPTFNRAFEVSRELLESLFDLAEGLNVALSWGSPLASMFGPLVDVPAYRGALSDSDGHQLSTVPAAPHSLSRASSRSSTQGSLLGRRFYSSRSSRNEELRSFVDLHAHSTQASPQLVHARRELVRRIEGAIKRAHGARYTVEVFGSSRYGMDKGDSDLDLVICDPALPNGFPPGTPKELSPIYNPYNVSKAIISARINVRIDQVIKSAAVPIVKVTDRLTHIRCDICCNDRLGLRNTELLAHYSNILPSLRVVVKTLKRWAKPLLLNEPSPSAGIPVTLSSYAFTLLAIGLYQARGILPNLQDVPSSAPGTDRVFWVRTRTTRPIKCNIGWEPLPLSIPDTDVPSTDALLLDFFRYYGFEHDYMKSIVSIRHGDMVRRKKPVVLESKFGKAQKARLGVIPLSDVVPEDERWDEEVATGKQNQRENKSRQDVNTNEDAKLEAAAQEADNDLGNVAEGLEADASAVQDMADAVVAEVAGPTHESVSEDEDEDDDADRPSSQASSSSDVSEVSREHWTEQDEELSNIQPKLWKTHALVVADPFIRSKNTAGNIKADSVLRFRAECQRAYTMLTQRSDEARASAMHTVLSPYVEGEDQLPTGPLPPLPQRPPPKNKSGKGKGRSGPQTQQTNAAAGPSAPRSRSPKRGGTAEFVPRTASGQRSSVVGPATPRALSPKRDAVAAVVPDATPVQQTSADYVRRPEKKDSPVRTPLPFEAPNISGSTERRGRGRPTGDRGGAGGRRGRGRGRGRGLSGATPAQTTADAQAF